MSADVDAAREALLTDADKLRTLATWFDRFDDWREATGKIAPGISEYREVQSDLRRIADELAAIRAEAGTLDVERLIQAADTVAHPAGVPPLSDEWWRVVAAEYDRLAGAEE